MRFIYYDTLYRIIHGLSWLINHQQPTPWATGNLAPRWATRAMEVDPPAVALMDQSPPNSRTLELPPGKHLKIRWENGKTSAFSMGKWTRHIYKNGHVQWLAMLDLKLMELTIKGFNQPKTGSSPSWVSFGDAVEFPGLSGRVMGVKPHGTTRGFRDWQRMGIWWGKLLGINRCFFQMLTWDIMGMNTKSAPWYLGFSKHGGRPPTSGVRENDDQQWLAQWGQKSGHGIRIQVFWEDQCWLPIMDRKLLNHPMFFLHIMMFNRHQNYSKLCLLAACILLCFSNRVSGPLWGDCSSLPAIKRGNAKWILFSVKPPSTSIFHYFPMIFPCSQSSMIVASPRPLRGISQPFPGTGGTAQDAPCFLWRKQRFPVTAMHWCLEGCSTVGCSCYTFATIWFICLSLHIDKNKNPDMYIYIYTWNIM